MQIRPITEQTPCYGICCPQHQACQRYAAVEDHDELAVLDTCDPGDGTRPQFKPLAGAEVQS